EGLGRYADGLRRDADAAAVQRGHRDLEAFSLFAQAVGGWDLHVGQEDLYSARSVDTELDLVMRPVKARGLGIHEERGDAAGLLAGIGHREEQTHVRGLAAGDEDLLP